MILDDIAAETRRRIERLKVDGYYGRLHEEMKHFTPRTDDLFYKNLASDGLSLICELKKASPSKGTISEDFPFAAIAKEYEAAGASAISCLTEPKWFKGDIAYLKKVAQEVKIPVLRKDFMVEEYQFHEARAHGADLVLLIVAALTDEELARFGALTHELGMTALVETHTVAGPACHISTLGRPATESARSWVCPRSPSAQPTTAVSKRRVGVNS